MKKITGILGWPAHIVVITILIGLNSLQDPPAVSAANHPTISSLEFHTSPRTYGIDRLITIKVTFSENVNLTGSPQLTLNIGDTTRVANFGVGAELASGEEDPHASKTDVQEVFFTYAVQEGDNDSDGIAIDANALSLNGGTIKDSDDNDADLTHAAVAADSDHKVDGVRPTVSSAVTSTAGTTITLTFSEDITVSSLVSWISEFLGVDLDLILIEVIRVTVAGIGVKPHTASISGTNLTLTMDTAITQGDTVKVSYILGHVSNIFVDTAASNALNGFTDQAVTNNSTVVTGTTAKGVVLNPTDFRIDEGETGTYTVKLTEAPTADVTVTISSSSSNASADLTSLTFTTANWNTEQTVTLTTTSDANAYDYWVRVIHTASGGGYDSVHGDLYVIIEDDH